LYFLRAVCVPPWGDGHVPPSGRCGARVAARTVDVMTSAHNTSRLARLADLTYRRRWRVVIAWIAVLAATVAIVPQIAGEYGVEFGTPGSESKAAADLLEQHFEGSTGDTVNVVWESPTGAREAEPRIDRLLADAERVDGIGGATEPRYSRDGTIGLVQLRLDLPAMDLETSSGKQLIDLAEEASGDGLRVEMGGSLIQQSQEGQPPELMGLLAAAVVLLIAFGSVVAAGLPLLVAIFGLGISASLIGIVALIVDTPDFAPAVAGLIGIGVGIDYALLILTRFRSAMLEGSDERAALAEALSTAGRSVIVAGGTVVISMLGLMFMGVSFLYGVAISASLAVLVVVVASVTLLPALLAIAGRRVDRLHIPGLGRSLRTGGGTLATRWSRVIQRRAAIAAAAGATVLILLTLPVLGLRYGFPDEGNDPDGSSTRAAYELVSRGFGPGSTGPLLVASEETSGLEALAGRVRSEEGVSFVTPIRTSPDGEAAVFSVMPTTSPQDRATADLVDRLREVTPEGVYVGGLTAVVIDQSDYVAGRIPLFIAGVVLLSFLLLLLAFRAPLIALKAGIMNLFSVGAAYGVVALAAEGGWFGSLLGVDTDTPVPPFIPVMMFAVLFGLSMDYEVFLLSRIREEYRRTGETSTAVADGLAKTARVITAAAAIMVVVFLAFIFSTEVFLKLMGLGMATAILVDATIVRMVLVPAVMQLMGRANWWTPRWLDRVLPRLDGEPVRVPAAAGERG
jgi:putative drug exporter of the RND superfamily